METKTIICTDKQYQLTLIKDEYSQKSFLTEKDMNISFLKMRDDINKLVNNINN